MGSNIHSKLLLLIIFLITLIIIVGCTTTATSISQQATTTSQPAKQPIEVISVIEVDSSPNPAGGIVEIVLKNVSERSIISLNVTLQESGERSWEYDFNVTPSNPLVPYEQISSQRRLIGGGWGGGVPYSLTINGTMESGEAFTFTWEPSA
jgi:hypothetical protein